MKYKSGSVYIRLLSAACAMSVRASPADLAAEKVVEAMKLYDPLSTMSAEAGIVFTVLRDATSDISSNPAKFKVFATDLAGKIEELVRGIKVNFRNIEHPWFLNFWTGLCFESVIHDFENLTRYSGVRALNIEKLTSNEFESLYSIFVNVLCKAIVNDLRTKSVGAIPEVGILCTQWYRVGTHFKLVQKNRDVLQKGIFYICDMIKFEEKSSFIKYVDINTRQRDDATPNRPLFERPVQTAKKTGQHLTSKLEELSTRVDTLWLRLENEVI